MTIRSDVELELANRWDRLHGDAAQREGWSVMECSGSSYGRWQIQKLDSVPDGGLQLADDEEAWRIVLEGCGDHHTAAIELIQQLNFAELRGFCQALVGKITVPPERVPIVAAALLSG